MGGDRCPLAKGALLARRLVLACRLLLRAVLLSWVCKRPQHCSAMPARTYAQRSVERRSALGLWGPDEGSAACHTLVQSLRPLVDGLDCFAT